MGHDDGSNDAHGLQQLRTAAAGARGQEQVPEERYLGWTGHHVLWGGASLGQPRHVQPFPPSTLTLAARGLLEEPGGTALVEGMEALASHLIAEGQGHNCNKESKKGFQLAQP